MLNSHRVCRVIPQLIASISLPAILALASPGVAQAHPGNLRHDFVGGLLHPLTGLDHLAAMLAVGLWGAQLSSRQRTALFVSFLISMLLGSGLGIGGVSLPLVEPAIAASVLLFGIVVGLAIQMPAWASATMAAAFALFHGYAHGLEFQGASAMRFTMGFLVTSAGLILAGHLVGTLANRVDRPYAIRGLGAAIAMFGACLFI